MIEALTETEWVKIQDIIAHQLEVKREAVTPEAQIIGDLGADSLDIVEIGMKVEEEFQMTISDEWMEKVSTVGDLCEAVGTLLGRSK